MKMKSTIYGCSMLQPFVTEKNTTLLTKLNNGPKINLICMTKLLYQGLKLRFTVQGIYAFVEGVPSFQAFENPLF